MGAPFSRICPLVGPCARRDITSNNALFPLPEMVITTFEMLHKKAACADKVTHR
jgi:hypothetical protein